MTGDQTEREGGLSDPCDDASCSARTCAQALFVLLRSSLCVFCVTAWLHRAAGSRKMSGVGCGAGSGVPSLAVEEKSREGVCKVLRQGDGRAREAGSSAFLGQVLELDLAFHEVCCVLVSPRPTGRYDRVARDAA